MILEKLKKIILELEESRQDAEKAENGNAAAGTRTRKAAMAAIHALKELRVEILERSKK